LKVIVPGLVLLALLFGCGNRPAGSSPGIILDNSFSSIEDLTEGFLETLIDGDLQGMMLIAADKDEFETYIWPYLPASNPGTNLTPEFVWEQSQLKSLSTLRSTMNRYAGRDIKLVGVELQGEVREYGRLKLFMEPEVIVTIDGLEKKIQIFGSVMELEGEYKIYSYSL
jgi:hypothetical protein